jgi:hypothetical protein
MAAVPSTGIPADPPSKAQVRCVPSTPAPPRKRRRPNQDLQQRLARCEEMLKAYAGVKPEAASPRTPHSVPPEDLRWQPTGKLVREDGNIRFVDNPMLGAIYDEVCTCLDPRRRISSCLLLESNRSGP